MPQILTLVSRRMLAALFVIGLLVPPLWAQGLFSPAIQVDEDAITRYELEQRARFLQMLRAPGNAEDLARDALIEDRLKKKVTEAAGITVTPEEIETGMDEFAARANLDRAEFIKVLQDGGVSPETFRDFVSIGLVWRDYVRARFLSRARPTDSEIDRALGASGGAGGVRVLLSEIIMPTTPENTDEVLDRADRIAQIRSTAAFSEEARRYSATNTRENGGRMNWIPITNLPPQLRPLILALGPGDVTEPITLPNAVALFQLRDIQETDAPDPEFAAIEYAAYFIPGGRSPEALARAAEVAGRIDTCDDLYGVARDQPPEVLDRKSLKPSEIERDIAVELAKLDDGEVSTALTRNAGQTLMLLMLCGRTAALNESATREEIATALLQQRLEALAQSHLDQLRADAVIIEK